MNAAVSGPAAEQTAVRAGAGVPDAALAAARVRLNRTSRPPSRISTLTTLLPLLAVAVPASVLLLAARLSWDSVVANATATVSRLAEAAAETGERTLGGYSVAAARVNDRLLDLQGESGADFEPRAHNLLAGLVAEFHPPVIAFAIDAAGWPIAASHIFPLPRSQDVADRDFFQALRSHGAPAVHVSQMFTGRFDNQLLVAVSRARRVAGPPGEPNRFDGLTTISIDPNTIGASLRRLLPDAHDTLMLVRDDGAPIASSVAHSAPLPAEPRDPRFAHLAAAAAPSGRYWSGVGTEGGETFVAVRRLAGFPVYATASRPVSAMWAAWWSVVVPYLAFGVPATVALLALSLRVRSDQVRLLQVNADLARDVERTADRLNRVRRYALVGAFEVDLITGQSLRSAEYMAVHGIEAPGAREAHADWLNRLHPDDRAIAEETLLRAIADGSGMTDYAQTYRTLSPSGEVKWIAARGQIERDSRGRALMMRGVHVDVTSLRSTELALAKSDARLILAQEAVGIGTWEWSPSTRALFLAPRSLDLLGVRPGEPPPGWRRVLRHILAADRAALRIALRDAIPSGSMRAEFRMHGTAANATPRWITIRARTLDLIDGKGVRLLGVAYDITERKLAEERAAMLAREIEHRARNAMTLVSGLVRITTAESHEAFVEALQGRIQSLARTITLLGRSRWAGAGIEDLLREELQPFQSTDAEGRALLIKGPKFVLDADSAQALSMALHELTTNSAKYGVLSRPNGTLSVTWRICDGAVSMTWKETGGPPIAGPPTRQGFGSLLIRSTFEKTLDGSMQKHWEPDGLRCEMVFPLRSHG